MNEQRSHLYLTRGGAERAGECEENATVAEGRAKNGVRLELRTTEQNRASFGARAGMRNKFRAVMS